MKVCGNKKPTGMLINARSDTLWEEFRDDATERRFLIPTDKYFKWSQDKNHILTMENPTNNYLFAGMYLQSGELLILTREAHPFISID